MIALSRAARNLFENWGVPASRLAVVPNGVDDTMHRAGARSNGRWLVAGRISEEKGVLELARSWPSGFALDIVGTGPLASEVAALERSEVALLGPWTRERLRESLAEYEGLVFPSTCLEMQPTIVLEAMSAGVPIVALTGNAASELVDEHDCGESYTDAPSLKFALARMSENRQIVGTRGREAFERNFTQGVWLQEMEKLYAGVFSEGRPTAGGGGHSA
jgi:glycosyltransferase involved in cell wall biosynthesis